MGAASVRCGARYRVLRDRRLPLLAAIGIAAVVAYWVAQRSAPGIGSQGWRSAQPESVLALVLREGMAFPAVGLVAGAVAAVALSRLIRSSLYEVGPTDPVVFGGTVVLLIAVSAVACLVPARRVIQPIHFQEDDAGGTACFVEVWRVEYN